MPPTLLQAAPTHTGPTLLQAAPKKHKGILARATSFLANNPLRKAGQQIAEGTLTSIHNRNQNAQDILQAGATGQEKPVVAGIGLAGQLAGTGADVIGAVLSPIAKPTVKALYNASAAIRNIVEKGNLDDLKKRDLAAAATAMETSEAAWNKYKKAHPNSAELIRAAANAADLGINFVGAGAAEKVGVDAAATGLEGAGQAIKPIAEAATSAAGKVGDLAQGAIDAAGPVLDKTKTALQGAGEMAAQAGNTVKRGVQNIAEGSAKAAEVAALPQAEKEAVRVGLPTTMLEKAKIADPTTKSLLQEMATVAEKATTDKAGLFKTRPIEVVGKKLVDTASFLSKKMKAVGKELGDARKGLRGKVIDMQPIQDALGSEIDSMRLAVKDGEVVAPKGVSADPDAVSLLNEIYQHAGSGNDAELVDLLRTSLSRTFSAAGTPLSTNVMRLATKYRELLLNQLESVSPEFGTLAKQYADSHKALEEFTKILGYKGSMEGITSKGLRAGEVARRMLGNAADRPTSIIEGLIKTAKEFGYTGSEDINSLISFADELEGLTGAPAGSLQGQMGKSIKNALGELPVVGGPLKAAAEFGAPKAAEKLKALKKFLESLKE